MSDQQTESLLTGKPFDSDAEACYEEGVEIFASELALEAKKLALKENSVSLNHVHRAYNIIRGGEKLRLILITLGSVLLGGFLSGFFSQMYSPTPNKIAIVLFVICGVVGSGMFFSGLFKR